jgi:UDP-N-acetylglucosamine acyltransferase
MISPLAQVHPNAKIGPNVTIDAFAVISENVEIGEGTHIYPHACLFDGARIGKHCQIFPGAVISAVPQDLKFVGEETLAVIGDHTTIRECVTINRGTVDKWKTVVGSHCLLMAYVHVAHDCVIGNHVILVNGVTLAGHITVDDYAIINGLTGVQQFIRIGAHSYIGGQSSIRKDVPPFVKAAREPLSYAGINKVGLVRRGFSKEALEEIDHIYHILFIQGHTTSNALKIIKESIPPSTVRDQIIHFIEESKAGIIKRFIKESADEDITL